MKRPNTFLFFRLKLVSLHKKKSIIKGGGKMIDGVYLTEAIDLSEAKQGVINLIQSPCGSGKSYFAIHKISKLAS